MVEFISPGCGTLENRRRKNGQPATGAELINRLRGDIYTGYPNLEAAARKLLDVAEMAWLREVSTWVLYGRLPAAADYNSRKPSSDFFIAETIPDGIDDAMETDREDDDYAGTSASKSQPKEYHIVKQLLPNFVTPSTASSLLFIGRALSMIRLRSSASDLSSSSNPIAASPEMTLLPIHLSYLQSLTSPLSPQKLSNAFSEIRLSLSQHTLQTLLPAFDILNCIHLLREFFLLGRGEFAINLIDQSSEHARNRWRNPSSKPLSKPSTTIPIIKEGEVAAILNRTFSILSSLQTSDDTTTASSSLSDRLDSARELLYLTLHGPQSPSSRSATPLKREPESFRDLLVGVPISLRFHLSWPLELFLHPSDLARYDALFSYLIAVRKAQMRLQALWKGRRDPPARRDREADKKSFQEREAKERRIWAAAAIAGWFLEQLQGYWQGEVIEGGFRELVEIISPGSCATLRPGTRAGGDDADEGKGDDDGDEDVWTRAGGETTVITDGDDEELDAMARRLREQQDPETLTRHHRKFLANITAGTFLSDAVFATLLKALLRASEQLAAGIEAIGRRRLVEEGVGGGGGIVDEREGERARREEESVRERGEECRRLVRELVGRLQRMDEERDAFGEVGVVVGEEEGMGVRRGEERGKVERLLMRMDLGSLGGY